MFPTLLKLFLLPEVISPCPLSSSSSLPHFLKSFSLFQGKLTTSSFVSLPEILLLGTYYNLHSTEIIMPASYSEIVRSFKSWFLFFFFFFFPLWPYWWHMKFPGQGQSLHAAGAMLYPLTHCARPGIEPHLFSDPSCCSLIPDPLGHVMNCKTGFLNLSGTDALDQITIVWAVL